MSYKGQYLRGEKWFHLMRDADGNPLLALKNDSEKMKDVDLYLSKQKPVVKEEVKTKSKGKK